MKVTTEACLFGAWVAENTFGEEKCALDIGTGTGLLSLMAAQHSELHITAVEINPDAARQASENFKMSPWRDRLDIIHQDITVMPVRKKYDVIFSNPPFYERSLSSPVESINLARHDSGLSFDQLINVVKSLLEPDGIFYVIFPASRLDTVLQVSANGHLYPIKKISVKQTDRHDVFREMIAFSFNPVEKVLSGTINIREGKEYSPRFIELLQPFYLNL